MMLSKKPRTVLFTVILVALLSIFAVGCTNSGNGSSKDRVPETPEPADSTASPQDSNAGEPIPSPENAQNVTVKFYLPNENADGFVMEEAPVAADAGSQELVDYLVQRGVFPEGSKVLDFRQDGKTLHVSMNHTYCDKVAAMGNTGETMLLGSLVNTMLTYYQADELNITCEGNVLETGHNVYDFPLSFFENESAEFPAVEAVLYLPTEEADGFYTEIISVAVDAEPQVLIFELVARGALPEGTTVQNFAQDGRTLSIDLSEQFREAVASTGSTGEYMMLGSLVNTLLTFYDADEIYLTTEGKPLETGHNSYDFAVGFYE